MNGSWHLYRPGERWQRPRHDMRIVIETDAFVAVGFSIPVAEFLDARARERQPALRALGPDLLAGEFDAAEATRRLRTQGSRPVGDALLDQRVVAGIGNVYRSEVLFLCGVSPFAPSETLTATAVDCLLSTARRLLQANVRESTGEAIITRPGLRQTTGRLDPDERVWVYGRTGKACRRCGTKIAGRKTGHDARATYWCPRCQATATDVATKP